MGTPYIDYTRKEALSEVLKEMLISSSSQSKEFVSGVDNITINTINKKKNYYINQLHQSLKRKKGYQFSKLSPFFIAKPNGDDRLICVPTVLDRIAQKAIYKYLLKTKYARFNGFNYGFVRGKGTKDAVNMAKDLRLSKQFVVKTDISGFFDNIDRNLMKNIVRNSIKAKSVHKFLFNVVNSEVDITNKEIENRINALGVVKGKGIRQGMPLSPFFANLFLEDFDMKIINKGISGIRYADDLIFFAKNEKDAQNILELCKSELLKLQLNIPAISTPNSKTQILNPRDPVEFLGISIEYDQKKNQYISTLSKKQKNKISKKYKDFWIINKHIKKELKLYQVLEKIDRTTGSYLSTYEDICDSNIFNTLKSTLLGYSEEAKLKLYEYSTGVELKNLNVKQKKFLGISN